ncbi:hypothetical protein BX666DRAFT_385481 [Dichotomocladium elegans]|nr:hypothetical protein BX666DRAFT_385481 [Dichotomocladium elegans]
MADRMASHEQHDERHMENCKAVSASLRGLHPADDVDVAVKRIQTDMAIRIKEFRQDIASAIQVYKEESRPSVAGRLEKTTQKDFRRRLRRVENGYNSLRQYFKFEVTQKIFPEPLFCKFCLICIEALMQEGEVMEAVTIEKEVKRFLESNKDLLCQRQILLDEFEDGVQTGRRELAGVVGKLFLKEGMRIQGENLALRRQHLFLQSMNESDQQGGGASGKKSNKNKKKKKKKKAATAVANENGSMSANESSRAPSACSSPSPVRSTIHKDEPGSALSDTTTSPQHQPEPSTTAEPGPEPANKATSPLNSSSPPDNRSNMIQAVEDATNMTSDSVASSVNDSPTFKERESESQAADTEEDAKGAKGWTTVKKSKSARRPQNDPDTPESGNGTTRPTTPITTTIEANGSTVKALPDDQPKSSSPPAIGSPVRSSVSLPNPSVELNCEKQQQQRLQQPPGLRDMATDMTARTVATLEELSRIEHNQLAALAFRLQCENSQLDHALRVMRQDMSIISRQYADAVAMARDREEQITQMYEARRRADIEAARQQINILEAKIVAMQQHNGLSPINCNPISSPGVMAGFGNQDLFAGYREQMLSSQQYSQKPWQISIRVRCGNCGELGHASAECKDACRYCGSTDHLSESCRFVTS